MAQSYDVSLTSMFFFDGKGIIRPILFGGRIADRLATEQPLVSNLRSDMVVGSRLGALHQVEEILISVNSTPPLSMQPKLANGNPADRLFGITIGKPDHYNEVSNPNRIIDNLPAQVHRSASPHPVRTKPG